MNVAASAGSVSAITASVKPSLDTANLKIDEIASHRVFARDATKAVKPPTLNNKLISLSPAGIGALQQRMTSSLGNKSHGIELSIEDSSATSFLQIAADAIAQPAHTHFLASSQLLTQKLATAQSTTSGLAGVVFVIRGRVGLSPRRFIAVIKAEVHDGFGTGAGAQEADVTYLESLALTPTQRLYKVGLLLELVPALPLPLGAYDPLNYRAFLFDHLITATETRAAAAYFYSVFLGMGIQKSAKKMTQLFFESTSDFIASTPLSEDLRWELREALRVELRSRSAVISVKEFADDNIEDPALRKQFVDFMKGRDFPQNAVVKDVQYVAAKLRRPRKMNFSTGVKILIPSDAEKDTVEVLEKSSQGAVLSVKGSFEELE